MITTTMSYVFGKLHKIVIIVHKIVAEDETILSREPFSWSCREYF